MSEPNLGPIMLIGMLIETPGAHYQTELERVVLEPSGINMVKVPPQLFELAFFQYGNVSKIEQKNDFFTFS